MFIAFLTLNSIVIDGVQSINSVTLTGLNNRLSTMSNRGGAPFQTNKAGILTDIHHLMRAQINKNSSDNDIYVTSLILYKYRESTSNEIASFEQIYSKMEKMSSLISRN